MASKLPWFILIAFVITKLLWNGFSEPLAQVHWDSVVHLYAAKRFSDTALIKHYSQHASAIAAQVDGHWSREETFSEAYWRFSRLGHIILLGTVVDIFGAGEEAIRAAHWLYNILMTLTTISTVVLVLLLLSYLDVSCPRQVVLWSAVGSTVLYMMSPIYDYMGRCLVSEVPAMLMLIVANMLLLLGLKRHSIVLSCLSGVFAFLTYSVRLESIWLYISFCAFLATSMWITQRRTQWWRAYTFSASTALVCYMLYAWYFYPLADPYLFILFAKNQRLWYPGVVPLYVTISVAGGLLWIGVFASVIASGKWTAARMPFIWAGIALMPSLPYFYYSFRYHLPLQIRMIPIILFLPLFLSSTLGWSYLWEQRNRYVRYVFFASVVLSTALASAAIWPGIEKVKYIRIFLTVPQYEQVAFRAAEMNRISQVLYSRDNPAFLVFDSDVNVDSLFLVRFFGPAYPEQADLAMMTDPAGAHVPCTEKVPAPQSLEPVSFCVRMTMDKLQELTEQGITIFSLTSSSSRNPVIMPFSYTEILQTQHYRLGIIAP